MELSLVSLADGIPPCRALLEQLGRPLVGLRHTLAFFVEKPEIIHRDLRSELPFVSQWLCDNSRSKTMMLNCAHKLVLFR